MQFFGEYNKLLSSPNYITRRFSIKMLCDVLLDKSNVKVMLRYVSSKENLVLVMNLFKVNLQAVKDVRSGVCGVLSAGGGVVVCVWQDQSMAIKAEAFNLFKVRRFPIPLVFNSDNRFDFFVIDQGWSQKEIQCVALGQLRLHYVRNSRYRTGYTRVRDGVVSMLRCLWPIRIGRTTSQSFC